ncbi:MAG: cyclic pyranopterin monophosphate synthase MoaC [Chloroflexi bacterium]|jgi:cyclic pyranopterin phosphate synthase|nr:cyclic pyranopterin monophosphate synthase MoaC [Anaerolineaceae bacterium]NLI44469.1 cyclic pyranopterin monophosphate synthase MoaC [Chloroflexota bacterium]HOE35542.1 cyclic pyranopterin monophosphate synthase MoaC [Anaerolineaceae bacterium]HOT26428.1 cyclic pyranopterin monophosphate synthase MoaC [Anaerolineaceae bacterium]HQK04281.1 cyclic pyranopterin monophosphate synthase MoaC [Anaerolineaceae bacterium]
MELSHLDKNGHARMVDVSAKSETAREAAASALVRMRPETLALIQAGGLPKGDVFACARVAGILAAKRTPELIPLCHPIPITAVSVDFETLPPDHIKIIARVKTTYKTGVEMEALTAVSTAALTVYDMCKAVDRGMQIEQIQLEQKSGGKSGDFVREGIIPEHD